ncbi:NADH dehydrogenase [ubiquinone] 1 alpha subcomplex subunit 9, mitochondrial [Culicoides brevitarsis]|uniref:NADH dehydrogenase [ubiquinone] 1 alpha subcomplex subunit 9, mitochondrial n=1 Tax=Culicoides brevitarsis TaxID=469753 RepID=UPI00307B2030
MASIIAANGLQVAKQSSNGLLGIVCVRAVPAMNYSQEPRPLKTTKLTSMRRGTGGRSSFNGVVATVFGCSGFLGRYVCNKLGKIGTQMILPYRGDHYDVLRLKVAGDLGQVLFHPYHLMDEKSIREAMKYSNVVINLVGREWETKNFKFEDVHVDGARRLARISREMGVERFIHVSALNASPHPQEIFMKGGSKFLKSKYEGELAVREAFPEATIFRPSDILGQEDRFLRYYAHIWRRQIRGMPMWKKGEATIKQPVYCSDLAQGIVNAMKDPETAGKVYQAVGPRRYVLGELVDWFYRVMRKDGEWGYVRYDMMFDPTFMMKVKATEMICPNEMIAHLHPERVEREYITDVVESGVPTLEDLGVNLTLLENVVEWELRPYRAYNYYDSELGEFNKPAPPPFIQ